ncbi:MAG: MFS transporter [Verrucomicrobia bacterium]|nr:MAG: MFS transporter [Verrucomicrobiota bacterium]
MSTQPAPIPPLWKHRVFQQLFWAHALSLFGSGLSSLALGLLAHQLVGASASTVLGITLAIRIVVIVLCSPLAGQLAAKWGARRMMAFSDVMRCGVLVGFFFADAVWQIYALAVLLNLGSAIFTPIYRAVIPDVVTPEQYPKAAALGSIAYDTANILSPSIAALVIALVGFRGNFVIDGFTFLASAALIIGLPRLATEHATNAKKSTVSVGHGLKAMFHRMQLRQSLFLALQTSIAGAFVIVSTVDLVKNELRLSDTAYAWIMGAFGVGSVCGALLYARLSTRLRNFCVKSSAPLMLVALVAVAIAPRYAIVMAAWSLIGTSYSILGVRGSELLAENSSGDERPHIFAAHFALSHAGWGLTYPLAGFLTTALGFGETGWVFAVIMACVSIPTWIAKTREFP